MLREWPAFEALAKSFAEGEVCLRVAGLTGAARALAVAELLQTHPRPALVVVAGMADAHRWTQDLKLFGTPAALGAPLLSRAEFADRTLRIAPGDRLDRELLLEALERSGYERVDTVV